MIRHAAAIALVMGAAGACGWAGLEYLRSTLPPAEQGPPNSFGSQASATLAVFDTGHISALARLYPGESTQELENVREHCATISADGRENVPVEAATPSHSRVVIRGHMKDDPHRAASCTFWLTWETDRTHGYWGVGYWGVGY